MKTEARAHDAEMHAAAKAHGLSPIQAIIIGNRAKEIRTATKDVDEKDALDAVIDAQLGHLTHPGQLIDGTKAAERIAKAIIERQHIVSLNDFDNDGTTSSAVIFSALVDVFGLPEKYVTTVIGNRFTDGYGLSEPMRDKILALSEKPDLVITADCGSSDEERIKTLTNAGIDVIVTDHHQIPEDGPPKSAFAFVNPTQKNDQTDSTIAGVGVAWLVMCLVRSALIRTGRPEYEGLPKLGYLLDYVALGTVADCVSLASPTNRAFVRYGLMLINTFKRPCWRVAKEQLNLSAIAEGELGYQIGPRINARSRMSDANAAALFLRSMNEAEVTRCFIAMDNDNESRKSIEKQMNELAFAQVKEKNNTRCSVAYHDTFHEGVQGIVASRLAEAFGKPSVVMSPSTSHPDAYKLSARTRGAIHICDAIIRVNELDANKSDPIVRSAGGHRGACGGVVNAARIDEFEALFSIAIKEQLEDVLEPIIHVDGSLIEHESNISVSTYKAIKALGPYGEGFPLPIWKETARVSSIRPVGKKNKVHLKVSVQLSNGNNYDGIWFNALENEETPLPANEGDTVEIAFKLDLNTFRGETNIQLLIEDLQI
ncbi:single-stranded-DNA-specific exonuclease RecJ [Idiomarina abyssalis]|uniref:Single-stranded-DNA-specific exonuclease RecJ n=1 Tax=Idiomarina abyssalis TaxID=86102 RepID=A0A8I1GAZ8_9GAMM|nr:DHH family phosphoesterase [Idiomarina abyssalis]MBJ7265611.1 DHH family phosphoesterase [Idiomarina abyssalis]MBJ7316715.1 DHH family phosphoesterase [Idiomarina abyssalis]